MVSTLLDELPCLLDEADELMARLSFHMTFLSSRRNATPATPSTDASHVNGDSISDLSREDPTQPTRDRQSSKTQSSGEKRTMTGLRQTLDAIDMDAIIKFFARHFLTMQSLSFEKMNASLPVEVFERKALLTFATAVYQLMKRIHHWQQTAWDSLTKFFTDNSRSDSSLLTLDSHPQLTRLVLATVAKYVKVHLLWSSFSVIPGLLALNSFLQHAQTIGDTSTAGNLMFSPLEQTDHRVREFVLHFSSAPLLAIQQDFQRQVADGGASLAALALSCFERYNACRDLTSLRNQGVFDLEALVGGAYASHPSLPGLLNCADIADWVICAVLCVPHQLQTGDGSTGASFRPPSSPTGSSPHSVQLWHFMEIIARDRLVLPLHRDCVVNLHDLLFQQLTSSISLANFTNVGSPLTSSKPSFGSGRTSTVPLKKTMTALSKQALRTSGETHRQRREIATWLLQNCVLLLRHNPGLVAPSYPLLLAVLTIARDEVEWIMSHGARTTMQSNSGIYKAPLLPNHVKPKHLQRVISSFSGAKRELADLLACSHRLRGLVELHSQYLAEYYQAFLVGGDAESIAYTIHELLGQSRSTSDMRPLLEGFLDNEHYRVDISSTPRTTWVREWRQANAHFAIRTQLPQLEVLRERMECAVRHSQYIGVSDQLIANAANFSKCWWFRDIVSEQCFNQALNSASTCSIELLEILSSLASGDYALDELVDREEAALQSERMTQSLESMKESIVNQLELGLEAIVKRDIALQRDRILSSEDEKAEQVENKVSSRTSRLSSFSRVNLSQAQRLSNAELRLPSPTSSASNRHNENSTFTSNDRKLESCGAGKQCLELARALLDHLAQHRDTSHLKNTISHRIQANFIRFVRSFVGFLGPAATAGPTCAAALRCSFRAAHEEIQCFLRVTQRLFGGRSWNYTIGTGDESSSLGEKLQVALARTLEDECNSSAPVLLQDKKLLAWALDAPQISEKELQQWTLVDRLTWLFVSLVTRKCSVAPSSSTPVSLPTILISVRRNCFLLASEVSGEIDPRDYTDREALKHLIWLIGPRGIDSICVTISNLLVAQALKLRSSLEAEYTALVAIDAALNGSASSELALAISHFRALDDITAQFIQIGTAAFLLQLLHANSPSTIKNAWEARVAPRILRELQQDADRRAMWTRLLPVASAAAFHATVWKRTAYLSNIEATNTNAHMMGLAMARLLPAPHTSPAVQRCAVAALARASTCTGIAQTARSKRPLQLDLSSSEAAARPLLEALELLVTAASSPDGVEESMDAAGSVLADLELALDRLLPRAVLVLYSSASA